MALITMTTMMMMMMMMMMMNNPNDMRLLWSHILRENYVYQWRIQTHKSDTLAHLSHFQHSCHGNYQWNYHYQRKIIKHTNSVLLRAELNLSSEKKWGLHCLAESQIAHICHETVLKIVSLELKVVYQQWTAYCENLLIAASAAAQKLRLKATH